jgi:lipoprotein-anchoring transpeptidase ErfK/SrfK
MPLLASSPHLRTLLVVPFLAAMLAFPAQAEPTPSGSPPQSEANAPAGETGTTGAPPAVSQDSNQEAVEEPGPATGDTGGKTENGEAATAPAAPKDGDAAIAPAAPDQPKQTILIDIDKSTQEMTVFVDGVQQYTWPVSTGLRGYTTPSGTYTASSMNEIWYSKQWDNAPMPNAIFFTKQGHAIHGTLDEKHLGNAASHGCVRLSRANAKTLFTLVKATGLENTQVVLSGTTKGGEGPKVASPGREPEWMYPPWFDRGDNFQQQKKKRRGLFGRRWFDDGPQGYYVPRNNYYYRRGY